VKSRERVARNVPEGFDPPLSLAWVREKAFSPPARLNQPTGRRRTDVPSTSAIPKLNETLNQHQIGPNWCRESQRHYNSEKRRSKSGLGCHQGRDEVRGTHQSETINLDRALPNTRKSDKPGDHISSLPPIMRIFSLVNENIVNRTIPPHTRKSLPTPPV
jgi:hypothetical protein